MNYSACAPNSFICPACDGLKKQVVESLGSQTLYYAVLSRPVNKDGKTATKLTLRPVAIKGKRVYQLTEHFKQKTLHTNFFSDELLSYLWPLIGHEYREVLFFTAEADFHVFVSKRMEWKVLRKNPTRVPPMQEHNRQKNYALAGETAPPFLVELGVLRSDGSVLPKMAHKFRQINRFIEIIADVVPDLPSSFLHLVDFGCGKSYLTFALYHYFHHTLRREVSITGLDLKADVIANCQALADKLGYSGLRFQVGDINGHIPKNKIDMVVSLHACDTATDAALEQALRWHVKVILCVPCCQKELYGQIKSEPLAPLLKHGILRERFAALATDAARAQLLEIAGYRTTVMEFVDMEHTPKNLLIRAVRGERRNSSSEALAIYNSFADALSITPSLQKRLVFS